MPPARPAADPADRPDPARLPATAKGRAMRDRLIAAAVECFATNGYHATAVADITAAAGTSHGNFYRYFDNVDDVLVAAVEPALARLLAAGRRPPAAEALDIEAIRRWQEGFVAAYVPDRVLLATMREAIAIDRGEGFTVAWRRFRAAFVDEMARWIGDVERALGPDPDGQDAATLAEVLGAMGEQTAYVHIGLAAAPPRPAELARLGRALAATLHRAVVGCRSDIAVTSAPVSSSRRRRAR